MKPRIIAIGGWRGSGKDTTAEILADHGYIRLSFADKLKEMVSEQYDIPLNYFHDRDLKEAPLRHLPVSAMDKTSKMFQEYFEGELTTGYWTPRALCILEGAAKRAVNKNFWVNQVIKEIIADPDKYYVIPDVRFESEIYALRGRFREDLETWRVQRYLTCASNDPSERDLDDHKFDKYISNLGSKTDLQMIVDNTIKKQENLDAANFYFYYGEGT